MAPASSNVHGQLDAQIAQLTQCKPLPEQEVSGAASSFALCSGSARVGRLRLFGC